MKPTGGCLRQQVGERHPPLSAYCFLGPSLSFHFMDWKRKKGIEKGTEKNRTWKGSDVLTLKRGESRSSHAFGWGGSIWHTSSGIRAAVWMGIEILTLVTRLMWDNAITLSLIITASLGCSFFDESISLHGHSGFKTLQRVLFSGWPLRKLQSLETFTCYPELPFPKARDFLQWKCLSPFLCLSHNCRAKWGKREKTNKP